MIFDIDLNDDYNSQESRRFKSVSGIVEASNDPRVNFSAAALRANLGLYVFTIGCLHRESGSSSGEDVSPSSQVTEYLMSLHVDDLVASRRAFIGTAFSRTTAPHTRRRTTARILHGQRTQGVRVRAIRGRAGYGSCVGLKSSASLNGSGQP